MFQLLLLEALTIINILLVIFHYSVTMEKKFGGEMKNNKSKALTKLQCWA